MVFVKPTVGLHRLAVTAFKSFNHGVAGALVAASQSSNASQNNAVHPKAYLNRLGKGDKSSHNVSHNSHAGIAGWTDHSDPESNLTQYYDAWQKHQKTGDVRDWQQFQFQKRIEYQVPASTDPHPLELSNGESLDDSVQEVDLLPQRGSLRRSYTTSAVDDFTKAIDNEAAEALAFAQVNEAIAEEVEKSKQEAEAAAGLRPIDLDEDNLSDKTVTVSPPSSTPFSTTGSDDTTATSPPELDLYGQHFDELLRSQQYAKVPASFEAMLRSGVEQPSSHAYRALMISAINITPGKHQTVPRVLDVYSDMIRRRVIPDPETYFMLVDLLATRALDASATKEALEDRAKRYGGLDSRTSFLFRADELEHAIYSEDQSLSIALNVFKSGLATAAFPEQSYTLLITACAKQGRLPDMIRLYQHVRSESVLPSAHVFPAMIAAFGAAGDLRNAVEAYDEYKKLAVANNSGSNTLLRVDSDVYAALINAYAAAENMTGAERFLTQIEGDQTDQLTRQAVRDNMVVDALIPATLKNNNFEGALDLAKNVSYQASALALSKLSIYTADANNLAISTKAFDLLARSNADLAPAAMAMLAMHIRNAKLEAAEPFWRILESSPPSTSFIEPATMRTVALINVGQFVRGMSQARQMWRGIREAQPTELATQQVAERIEEAIEIVGKKALATTVPLPTDVNVELLRMMVENGSLVNGLAEHSVASFGPEQIAGLLPADICLLTKVQARMILDESAPGIAGPARFACLLENIVSRQILPDVSTENLIEKTLVNLDNGDLSRLWNNHRYPMVQQFSGLPPFAPYQAPPPPAVIQPAYEDSFDPYAIQTDNKGSVAITDLLEKPHGKSASYFNEALTKFHIIRRAGRHPRFFAYAKLISAAAKENKLDLAHDILEMAKQDVPYNPQYRVVRHGWSTILDSMLSATLIAGRRDLAEKYHQDLLEMGATPSANTYGLYITTLKENTKTFDEATEAVRIFTRAESEGVEPTSFLYNALIGKLGKARRIDDCLFYFSQMRNLGVVPTSVTYGTMINALCRVSDEKFAEEIMEEMESRANYKPRPAPYHSLMQHFLQTKRDRSKVLGYYERMRSKGIQPTMHTYKLLIDTHATLEPINMPAAEEVLKQMRDAGEYPEAVHFASLIHAKGCVQRDMAGARALFDSALADNRVRVQPCLYQALFESLVANNEVASAEALLSDMAHRRVEMTPYIANALIHGWTMEKNISRAKRAFERVRLANREPSTYEAMVRAHLAVEDHEGARQVVREALSRGYPAAVSAKIAELVGGSRA